MGHAFLRRRSPLRARPHDLTTVALEAGHHWLLDTYVNGHQIGHWAESLALFHAIHLQASSYGLPPVRRLIFNKVDPPLSDHERFFYDISIKALPYPIESPIWCGTGALGQAKGGCRHCSHAARGSRLAGWCCGVPQGIADHRPAEHALLRQAEHVVHHRGGTAAASASELCAGGWDSAP